MLRGLSILGATVIASLVIAACGGASSPAASTAAGASPSADGGGAPASAAASAEASAAASAAASTAGGAAGVCSLMTADEVAQVTGVAGLTTDEMAGEVAYCSYAGADGKAVAATSFQTKGGADVFAIWKSGSESTAVPGIGDDAVFDGSSATLFILKGDKILGLTAGDGQLPNDQRLTMEKQLGAIAAGRM